MTWSLAVVTGPGRPQLLAGCEDGVFESTDGGDHWTPVALPTSPEIWRVAVAIAPSDVSVAYVWAAYAEGSDSGPHAVHRLYKRVQGKWTRQQEFVAIKLRAGHNWVLAVSPTQPNRVYCGAIHLWRGDLGADEPLDAAELRQREVPHSSRLPRARFRSAQLRHRVCRVRRRPVPLA